MKVHQDILWFLRTLAIYFAIMLCLMLAFCIFAISRAQTGQHGDGHAEQHEIYKDWVVPNNPGSSCCKGEDCRPTRAYVDPETGQWRAWNGKVWLVVPWDRVLPTDYAHDGRSHICEKGDQIYCFTPGEIRG